MPFIGVGFEAFYENIISYRACWFRGRQGGGKTSLAFRIAYELLRRGDVRYLCSNVPNVWNTKPSEIQMSSDNTLDVVFVLDEGGLILQSRRDVFDYLAALRKLNVVILIPSFFRPNPKVCFLRVQRLLNLQKMIGVPAWNYRYTLQDADQRDEGDFSWVNASEIYGIYSSKSFPTSDGGFRKMFKESVKRLTEMDEDWRDKEYDTETESEITSAEGRETNGDYQRGIDELTDAISEMADVGGEFEDTVSEARRVALLLSKPGRNTRGRR